MIVVVEVGAGGGYFIPSLFAISPPVPSSIVYAISSVKCEKQEQKQKLVWLSEKENFLLLLLLLSTLKPTTTNHKEGK